MVLKIDISKTKLENMYEKENLTTFEIAERIGCCQATVWKRLKEFNINMRLPGGDRVKITKKELQNLYFNKKFSTWKIEKETGIPRGTIHRKLKEFGLNTRDRADSHIIYPRKDFSGNLIEKAYLVGFRIGDLGVRKIYPNSKTICVASGSTIQEQINLIEKLFKNYGHIWIGKKTKDGKINIQIFLNESFNFLLGKEFPKWVQNKKELFFSFLAGFTDAEGHIGISKNMAYYSLGNYDSKILSIIHKNLNKFGINCNALYEDHRLGQRNNQGYQYNSNYWTLRINDKKKLLKFIKAISPFLKHENKVKALNMAFINIEERNKIWQKKNSTLPPQ